MAMEHVLGAPLLWLSFAAPLAAGIASLVAGRRLGARGHAVLAVASWVAAGLLLLPALAQVYRGAVALDPLYSRVPGIGVFALVLDGVSAPIAVAVVLVSLLVAVYSLPYMRHRFEEMGGGSWALYYSLYQMFTAGMLGAAMASNGVLFYLFLELTLLPSALLIILYGYGERLKVGLIYLVWTHVGALLFLLGLFLAGRYDFYIPGQGYVVGVSESLLALALVVLGLGVKSAYLGLHLWLPYAHAEAPTPVSALLSPLLIGLGGYALIRAGVGLFHSLWASTGVELALFAWAVATMVYGGLLVLVQRDVKRLFAYSSVSQMGYMLLGLAVGNAAGLTGAVLHYVAHALGKAILFGVAGVFIALLGTRSLEDLGGLAQLMPRTAAVALLGFALISGLPPTLGLWSEVYLAFGYAQWGMGLGPGLFAVTAAAAAAAMTLTVVYSFQAFRLIFLGRPGPVAERLAAAGVSPEAARWSRGLLVPLALLALAGVVFFVAVALLAGPASATLSRVYAVS